MTTVSSFLSILPHSYFNYYPDKVFAKMINQVKELEISNWSEKVQQIMKLKAIRDLKKLLSQYQNLEDIAEEALELAKDLQLERDQEAVRDFKISTSVLIRLLEIRIGEVEVEDSALNKIIYRNDIDDLTLLKWSESPHLSHRLIAAANINTPPNILANLSKDYKYEVRATVAANINTSQEILWRLLTDEQPQIQAWLARRQDIPLEFLQNLAEKNTQNTKVLINLFANPKYPNRTEIIENLLKIGLGDVNKVYFAQQDLRGILLAHIEELLVDADGTYSITAYSLGANSTTPGPILGQIAVHTRDVGMLRDIFNHSNCTPIITNIIVTTITNHLKSGYFRQETCFNFLRVIASKREILPESLDLILEIFPDIQTSSMI